MPHQYSTELYNHNEVSAYHRGRPAKIGKSTLASASATTILRDSPIWMPAPCSAPPALRLGAGRERCRKTNLPGRAANLPLPSCGAAGEHSILLCNGVPVVVKSVPAKKKSGALQRCPVRPVVRDCLKKRSRESLQSQSRRRKPRHRDRGGVPRRGSKFFP